MTRIYPVLSLVAMVGCGLNDANLHSEIQSETASGMYACHDAYFDKSVQENALWTESFEANFAKPDSLTKKFGVSPGIGNYYASLGMNKPDEVAAMILNNDTKEAATAIYDRSAKKLMVVYQKSDKQTFVLACALK